MAVSPFYQSHEIDATKNASWYSIENLRDNHQDTIELNSIFFKRLETLHYPVGPIEPAEGASNYRFRIGGCYYYLFNTLPLTYELNSRYPSCRLSLGEFEQVGHEMVASVQDYLHGASAAKRLADCQHFLALRAKAIDDYWKKQDHSMTEPNRQDLLEKCL